MKRVFYIFMIIILLSVNMSPALAAEDESNVSAELDKSNYLFEDTVTISGQVTKNGNGFSYTPVIIKVENKETESKIYVDEAYTDSEGNFKSSFKLAKTTPTGDYVVNIDAIGLHKTLEFALVSTVSTLNLSKETYYRGETVNISGTAYKNGQIQSNVDVIIKVLLGQKVKFVKQLNTDSNGTYSTAYGLKLDQELGTYLVQAELLDGKVEKKFEVKEEIPVVLMAIKITGQKDKIKEGEETELKVKGTMSDGSSAPSSELEGVKWSSTDEGIVKVNNAGVVTGIKKGTTAITAAIGTIKDSINIEVYKEEIPVVLETIKIAGRKDKIKEGEEIELKVKGTMSDGSSAPSSELEGVKWSSTDEGIAKVNNAGVVTGIKEGTTAITAAIGTIKDSINIEVYKKHSGGGSSSGGSSSTDEDEETKNTDAGKATIIKDKDGNITVELEVNTNKLESQIKDTSKNTIIIDANIEKDADEVIINMDYELLSKTLKNNKKLVINTGSAVIEIEPDSIAVTKGEKIKLSVTNLDDKKTSKLISKKDSNEYKVVSPIADFNLLVDNSHKTFNKPVTIKIEYNKSKVKDIRKLGVYYYNEKANKWEYVGGKANEDGTIEFSVNHFSKYTAMMYNKVFADVDMPWAKDAIEVLTARHIIDGIGGNKYDPNGNITRAQFAKLLVYALDLKSGNGNVDFIDVQSGAWYEESVKIAGSLGIVTGYDGKFDPDGQITREAMATMIVRALKYADPNDSYIASNTNFADQDDISKWAEDSVSIAFNKGLVSGVGNNKFAPKQNATRAQAAVMIYRLLEVLDLL